MPPVPVEGYTTNGMHPMQTEHIDDNEDDDDKEMSTAYEMNELHPMQTKHGDDK